MRRSAVRSGWTLGWTATRLLTQAQMADLFGRERSVVTKHVRNVFADGKLVEESNVQDYTLLIQTN